MSDPVNGMSRSIGRERSIKDIFRQNRHRSSLASSISRWFRRNSLAYLLVLPMVTAMALLILYPIGRVIYMSFHDFYLARPGAHPFIGLTNYLNVVKAFEFANSVKVTAIYILVTVPVRFILALALAVFLNEKFPGRGFVRSMAIIPWALPVVIAGLIWVWILNPEQGIINYTLLKMRVIDAPISWLGTRDYALPATMFINIWKGTPFIAIMLLAGLQSIPHELYEAGMIDGASAWRRFTDITIPMLKPVISFSILLLFIWTMRDFDIVYVMTYGGPARATELFTIFIYNTAFKSMRLGEASAAGVLLLLVSLVFTVFFLKLTKGDEAAA